MNCNIRCYPLNNYNYIVLILIRATYRHFLDTCVISSSIRSLFPLKELGCGPIICTSCGISGDTCNANNKLIIKLLKES